MEAVVPPAVIATASVVQPPVDIAVPLTPVAPPPQNTVERKAKLGLDEVQRNREALDSLLATLQIPATETAPKTASPAARNTRPPLGGSTPPVSQDKQQRLLQLKLQEDRAPFAPIGAESSGGREDTLAALGNLQQAPAMGWLAQNFVQLTKQQSIDLGEVVAVVEKDPAITARVLRMANSALVASEQRIGDLPTAVAMLGVQRVRLTAQALTTMQETRSLVSGFNWQHLWIHSFACAMLSAEIPKRLKLPELEHAYLAGLVHDLGKILLSYLEPAKYRQLLLTATVENVSLRDLERQHFGVTHEEAGAVFARQNRFPDRVIAAVEFHSRPGEAGSATELAAVVNVANYLAKTYGLGFSGAPLAESEDALEDTPGWKLLQAGAAFPQSGDDFQVQLRPFLSELKHQLHEWASGKH